MQKIRLKGITLSALLLLALSVSVFAKDVYLGGFPFGVKMTTDGVYVSAIGDVESTVGKVCPARDAGIKEGDVILSIDGTDAESATDVADIIEDSDGKRLKTEIKRGEKCLTVNLIPVKDSETGGYKTGMYIKDSASGIGTVTFVDEDKQTFGGLGHGITDRMTAEVLPLKEGTVHSATVTDVVKGTKDMPGELKGVLDHRSSGKLLKNTEMGIFGKWKIKADLKDKIEVAKPGEIKKGECSIYTCLDGNTPCKLNARITEIVDKSSKTKNFTVNLTDKDALTKIGGIVQGMSGSPIIQNGKLVGAVTHVLMKDQTSGYGIFIENMLAETGSLMTKSSN